MIQSLRVVNGRIVNGLTCFVVTDDMTCWPTYMTFAASEWIGVSTYEKFFHGTITPYGICDGAM